MATVTPLVLHDPIGSAPVIRRTECRESRLTARQPTGSQPGVVPPAAVGVLLLADLPTLAVKAVARRSRLLTACRWRTSTLRPSPNTRANLIIRQSRRCAGLSISPQRGAGRGVRRA